METYGNGSYVFFQHNGPDVSLFINLRDMNVQVDMEPQCVSVLSAELSRMKTVQYYKTDDEIPVHITFVPDSSFNGFNQI